MPTSQDFSVNKLGQKGVVHLLLPIILILGLIAGVYLVTSGNPLKIFSKASNDPIVFKDENGNPYPKIGGNSYEVRSPKVKIEITSTLGPPASSVSSPISPNQPSAATQQINLLPGQPNSFGLTVKVRDGYKASDLVNEIKQNFKPQDSRYQDPRKDFVMGVRGHDSQTNRPLIYNPRNPQQPDNSDFPVKVGEGYIIDVQVPGSSTIQGQALTSPITITIPRGRSLIAFPVLPNTVKTASDLVSELRRRDIRIMAVTSVTQEANPFRSERPQDNNFSIQPAVAYYLDNVSPAEDWIIRDVPPQTDTHINRVPGCNVCNADINQDGNVNITDFSILSSCYMQSGSGRCLNADINIDGRVNGGDYACLSTNFRKQCPARLGGSTPNTNAQVNTTKYRIAESPAELSRAPEVAYTIEPTVIDYEFKGVTESTRKHIFVEFIANNSRRDIRQVTIDILLPRPTPAPNFGKAIKFDNQSSNNAYARVATDKLATGNPFTVEAWVKTDKPDTGNYIRSSRIVTYVNPQLPYIASGRIFSLTTEVQESSGEFRPLFEALINGWTDVQNGHLAYIKVGQGIGGNPILQPNMWYHIAATSESTSSQCLLKMYVNGVLIATSNRFGQDCQISKQNPQEFILAKSLGSEGGVSGYYYSGEIDELRISNIVRYTSNFTPQITPFSNDTNTLALYHFDSNMNDSSINNLNLQGVGNIQFVNSTVNYPTTPVPTSVPVVTPSPTPKPKVAAQSCSDISVEGDATYRSSYREQNGNLVKLYNINSGGKAKLTASTYPQGAYINWKFVGSSMYLPSPGTLTPDPDDYTKVTFTAPSNPMNTDQGTNVRGDYSDNPWKPCSPIINFVVKPANPTLTPTPTSSPTPAPQATAKRVFVTSTTYNGNLGGLSGADAKCQARANAASLGGTWKAWLSDSNTSASSRLTHSSVPYVKVGGSTPIANNWTDLTDGQLNDYGNIDVYENGNRRAQGDGTYYAWTGTNAEGGNRQGAGGDILLNCNNWTSGVYPTSGRVGSLVSIAVWSDWNSNFCGTALRLYCFEQ